ncbi:MULTISPECIES: hypothetical protein [Actinomycetes]|uniref:hypothetical protein n=1 Tax=Actinomycetes TaxID=1760 RepID=UPI0004BF3980|nr:MULTISPECIES: hypothetical protein [Actinomycetes]
MPNINYKVEAASSRSSTSIQPLAVGRAGDGWNGRRVERLAQPGNAEWFRFPLARPLRQQVPRDLVVVIDHVDWRIKVDDHFHVVERTLRLVRYPHREPRGGRHDRVAHVFYSFDRRSLEVVDLGVKLASSP